MPRSPILHRTLYTERLSDGSSKMLDFALVNTTLGGGIEPRPHPRALPNASAAPDTGAGDSQFEESFNEIREIKDDGSIEAFQLTMGLQTPKNW